MNAPSWEDAAGQVRSVTLTASTACDHCALPVPINGPVQVLRCPHCQKDTPIPQLFTLLSIKSVASTRSKVRDGYDNVDGRRYQYTLFHDASPDCGRCGSQVAIAAYLAKSSAATTLACASCQAPVPTFPVPAWLKEKFPTALQVFGGDAEVAREQAGLDLVVNEGATKPIAMACPSCGGGLSVRQDTERTMSCPFCASSVFLPDELWKRLHPAKTMQRWTLTYTGKLASEALDELEASARNLAESYANLIVSERDLARRKGKSFDLDAAIATHRAEFEMFNGEALFPLFEAAVSGLRPPPSLSPAETATGKSRKFPIGVVLAIAGASLVCVAVVAVVVTLSEPKPAPSQQHRAGRRRS
jgi:hypothetical protein